ncbi:MAG TPA: AsmA family protein [Alphaproteobacteria bacterium]|nr:AsmA family protein [Alphaproteobacteria bacterium]
MARSARITSWILLGIAVLVLAAILFVATFDWNRLKGVVASRVGEATGRELSIEGNIDIDWGWVPRITLERVTLSNADWSRNENMAEVDRLSFTIDLKELLSGQVVLPEVTLDRPRLVMERNPKGDANWTFEPTGAAEAATPDDRAEIPIVERLTINEGEVVYRDPNREIDVQSKISTVVGEAEEGGGGSEGGGEVTLEGTGTLAGEPFEMQIQAGALTDLRNPDKPYPLKGTIKVGDTEAEIDGELMQPGRAADMNFSLALNGENVGELFPVIGLPAPTTPPYDVTGRLVREDDIWRFEEFGGRVGDSDLAGTLVFDTGGERLRVTGDLVSERLDFADLGGLVGAPTGPDAGAAAPLGESPEAEGAGDELLPTAPADFEKFRTVDAEVSFRGTNVNAPNLPLENVRVNAKLDGGILRLEPLEVGVAGGEIFSTIQIDAREDTVVSDLDVHLDGFRLEQVLEGAGGTGEIFGRAQLRTWGNSVNAAFGTADGDVALMMNDGTFSSLFIELIGLDAAEALGVMLSEDEEVAIRCAVLDFSVQDGLMQSRVLVIDTTDTAILGEGAVDLEDEAYEVEILAHPKDPSLFSARAPVTVAADSFTDFGIGVDAAALGLRAGIAVALGAVLTPLAGALAFIEPGSGEDSPCGTLISRAQENTEEAPD